MTVTPLGGCRIHCYRADNNRSGAAGQFALDVTCSAHIDVRRHTANDGGSAEADSSLWARSHLQIQTCPRGLYRRPIPISLMLSLWALSRDQSLADLQLLVIVG